MYSVCISLSPYRERERERGIEYKKKKRYSVNALFKNLCGKPFFSFSSIENIRQVCAFANEAKRNKPKKNPTKIVYIERLFFCSFDIVVFVISGQFGANRSAFTILR